MHLQGSQQAVAIMEAIMRSNVEMAQVLKKKSPLHSSWLYETPRDVMVRTYEVPIMLNGSKEMYKVKFVLDKRAELNKIDIIGQSIMESVMDCVPDPSSGVCEIMIGEYISSRVEVVRLGQVRAYELAVRMVCPFCQGHEIHQCEEPDEQRDSNPNNSNSNSLIK